MDRTTERRWFVFSAPGVLVYCTSVSVAFAFEKLKTESTHCTAVICNVLRSTDSGSKEDVR